MLQRAVAWQKAQLVDVALKAGTNTIAVAAKNRLNGNGAATPGAFIARLQADGETVATSWNSSATGPAGWEQPTFDDAGWQAARELATYGQGPWGGNVSLPSQSSPYLRKDFQAGKPGIRPDGSLQDAGMNSFNHFGLGSIGDWLYDVVGGLAPLEPGYKKQLVAPSTGELDSASSAVKTAYGPAKTAWSKDAAGRLTIDVDVPVNTRAEVRVPITDGQTVFESGKPAAEQPGVIHKGTANGIATYEVGSGSYRFLAAVSNATSVNADVAGTVPATLSLSVGAASLGALVPGVTRTYSGEATAAVTSTAGDAALSVFDPGADPGRLVNGAFALAQPLQIDGKPVGGSSTPTPLHAWVAPVSNGAKTLAFTQAVGADEGLRTGSYGKTLTFTLSTTTR